MPDPVPERCVSSAANPIFTQGESQVVSHCLWYRGPDPGRAYEYDWAGNVRPGPVSLAASFAVQLEENTVDEDYRAQISEFPICDVSDPTPNSCSQFRFSFEAGTGHHCPSYQFTHQAFLVRVGNSPMLESRSPTRLQCPMVYEHGTGDLTAARTIDAPCTPGSAIFDMQARGISNGASPTSAAVQLVPIARSDVRPPERAWLRQVRVLDWGGVQALHIANNGAALAIHHGSVSGGHTLSNTVSQQTLPVGAASISANMAIEGVDPQSFPALPVVEMSWSCEPNPAFTALEDHIPFLLDASSLGFQHRMVIWVKQSTQQVRIAPYGRLIDYATSAVAPDGSFSLAIEPYHAHFSGRMSRWNSQLVITDGVISRRGLPDIALPTVNLPRI